MENFIARPNTIDLAIEAVEREIRHASRVRETADEQFAKVRLMRLKHLRKESEHKHQLTSKQEKKNGRIELHQLQPTRNHRRVRRHIHMEYDSGSSGHETSSPNVVGTDSRW